MENRCYCRPGIGKAVGRSIDILHVYYTGRSLDVADGSGFVYVGLSVLFEAASCNDEIRYSSTLKFETRLMCSYFFFNKTSLGYWRTTMEIDALT